jgi:hypothetical protein
MQTLIQHFTEFLKITLFEKVKETDRGAKKTECKHLNTNQLKKVEILAARRYEP